CVRVGAATSLPYDSW
nr:immunoglobulin heavy chain junction region [Macaca mulatta]MOW24312.1 immunoglobulin heavy chain junction region [Macaca mulatta]MOW24375.1 immunoglobulin heavy chain junction region [Macaca mulatta]MOW24614.1 immunoglobulin heavy chain junction region [Macaca mulatta]MOW24824.1 immunoglobulin heavy chain junction region [Macaca mulatta]